MYLRNEITFYSRRKSTRIGGCKLPPVSLLVKYCKKRSLLVLYVLFKVIWKNEERDWILTTVLLKLQEKVQCVRGERKLNFGNEITEILVLLVLPSLLMKCPKCGGVLEMETNCGKLAMALSKMGEKKKKKEELWQLSCRKWREKKRCYVHNKLQVVSCYWFKFESNTKITFLPQ